MSNQGLGPRPKRTWSDNECHTVGALGIVSTLGLIVLGLIEPGILSRPDDFLSEIWFCVPLLGVGALSYYLGFILPKQTDKAIKRWDEANAQIQLAEKKAAEEKAKAAERKAWEKNALSFYSACVSRKIDIDNPDISIIADSFNIGEDKKEAFEFGRSEFLARKEAERKAKDAEEKAAAKRMADFAEIVGKEKYLREFKSRLDSANARIIAANAISKSLMMPAAPRTSDWAIAGGMAQGLAGPAAGTAAALNTMKKNQEARGAYEQQWQSYENCLNSTSHETVNARTTAEDATKVINHINEKLIRQDESNLFSILAPSETSISLSPGGNIIVNAAIESMFTEILGNEACIDGSIKIEVVDTENNSVVAYGVYAAPGLKEDPLEAELHRLDADNICKSIGLTAAGDLFAGFPLCTRYLYMKNSPKERQALHGRISALCIRTVDEPITCCTNLTCKFYPHHLWAIER